MEQNKLVLEGQKGLSGKRAKLSLYRMMKLSLKQLQVQ